MTDLSGRISIADVGLSLLLVLVAVVVSRTRKADLERDIVVATFRSFVQLLAVGFVLDLSIGGQTKVVGLVALPGAMTGMILAGASPTAAIRLQLVVMYMLLGGNAFAALVAGQLTVRRLFTADHQLIRSLSRNG